jgi:hypothetical protein
MLPKHPCPPCGHESASECQSAQADWPRRPRIHCNHCLCECISVERPSSAMEVGHPPGPGEEPPLSPSHGSRPGLRTDPSLEEIAPALECLVHDSIKSRVATIAPGASLREAAWLAALMRQVGMNRILMVEREALVGIVARQELVNPPAASRPRGEKVEILGKPISVPVRLREDRGLRTSARWLPHIGRRSALG